ncbi:hypothetical protein HYALB_00002220 [Hymenoscyphus albidus]|uniref:PD-(D/E)XK nuclease-like domain-containing protein n=1 Tax=Hymenoscyphus albidus TaxID=595503 RepID=A0A9N9LEC8_9HELO|nr:hypothetical protein HYALB_00002220 [Hymenoscyphus albidus]
MQDSKSNRFLLTSWLSTADDWLSPTELQQELQQQDQSPFLLSQSTLVSPPSQYSFTVRNPTKGRSRKRLVSEMNQETASNASGESTRTTTTSTPSFHNRPILNPTPPSSRQRSPSPTRKVLSQLRLARPSLRVCQPDIRVVQPPRVQQLRSMLVKKLSSGVIPRNFETRLRNVDPDLFEEPSSLFETAPTMHSTLYLDNLWKLTDKIYNEARRCYDNHLDESAWMKVVNNVLEAADLDQDSAMLRVHSIQTQSIEPVFLPKHTSQSFAKKADLALAFSSDHPKVAAALEPVHKANPDLALSQMTDAYTSTVPLVCCLKVKERGGDYNEAIVQLGIWCTAGLERLRGLWVRTSDGSDGNSELEELPPFLGWTVVGHDWKFHIVWKDASGNVIVLGPWRVLNAGTGSHTEILILLSLIQSVKRWLEGEYWAWLCENVLDKWR